MPSGDLGIENSTVGLACPPENGDFPAILNKPEGSKGCKTYINHYKPTIAAG